jgi:hypothetical protein
VIASGGALPEGVRVALVPSILRPSALYPVDEAAVDASGAFVATGTVGEHELTVRGLPAGWGVRGARPSLWLTPGGTIDDVRVEIGPGPSRAAAGP